MTILDFKRFLLFLIFAIFTFVSFSYAQSRSGSEGSSASSLADEPITLPGNATELSVIPTLKFDTDLVGQARSIHDVGIDELRRGIGTLRLTADRRETREQASDAVMQAMLKARRAATGSTRGLMTLPPGIEDRKVFYPDDREPVYDTASYPFRTFGQLWTRYGNQWGTCSGTLIGPRTVLTAAHCVYDHESYTWGDEIRFYPGADGDYSPFGYYGYDEVTIPSGYAEVGAGNYTIEHSKYDIAVVTLIDNAGDRLGWQGYTYFSEFVPFTGNLAGYPGDKDNTMWLSKCDVDPSWGSPDLYHILCDITQGSSGSGLYRILENGDRYVFGVLVSESTNFNSALRLNEGWVAWINRLRR